MKTAMFLGVGRSLPSVPWAPSNAGVSFSQTWLILSHVRVKRGAPHWLRRGPWRVRQRGDSSIPLRMGSLALGRGQGLAVVWKISPIWGSAYGL